MSYHDRMTYGFDDPTPDDYTPEYTLRERWGLLVWSVGYSIRQLARKRVVSPIWEFRGLLGEAAYKLGWVKLSYRLFPPF